MARRIWIIKKTDKIKDKDRQDAETNNCGEIANGIPPSLIEILSGQKLPLAYEEPELPTPTDWSAEFQKAETDADRIIVMAKKLGILEKKEDETQLII